MRHSLRAIVFTLLSALCLMTCIVPAQSSSERAGRSPSGTSVNAPLIVRSSANFDDKVVFVGAALTPGRVIAGQSIGVHLQFKVTQVIPVNYTLFVHIEDADGKIERGNSDHIPKGGTYPTTAWKVGEVIDDTFAISIPISTPVKTFNIWFGFWDPATDTRMPLKNPGAVRNDGNNRLFLGSIPVDSN